VYVCGYQRGSSGLYVAKYWKNGVEVLLSDGSSAAETTDILIVGNDIYVTGRDGSETLYWKNGVRVVLNDPSYIVLNKIFVDKNDVYLAGLKSVVTGSPVATYWKNGNEVKLSAANGYAGIRDIVVQNGDVYLAGYEKVGTWIVARFWKNGEAITISDPSARGSYAVSIGLRGKDVYVAFNEDTPDYSSRVRYWHNGKATTISETAYTSEVAAMVLK
jgi:hypothetical protein